jgi:hypothetical protein
VVEEVRQPRLLRTAQEAAGNPLHPIELARAVASMARKGERSRFPSRFVRCSRSGWRGSLLGIVAVAQLSRATVPVLMAAGMSDDGIDEACRANLLARARRCRPGDASAHRRCGEHRRRAFRRSCALRASRGGGGRPRGTRSPPRRCDREAGRARRRGPRVRIGRGPQSRRDRGRARAGRARRCAHAAEIPSPPPTPPAGCGAPLRIRRRAARGPAHGGRGRAGERPNEISIPFRRRPRSRARRVSGQDGPPQRQQLARLPRLPEFVRVRPSSPRSFVRRRNSFDRQRAAVIEPATTRGRRRAWP